MEIGTVCQNLNLLNNYSGEDISLLLHANFFTVKTFVEDLVKKPNFVLISFYMKHIDFCINNFPIISRIYKKLE